MLKVVDAMHANISMALPMAAMIVEGSSTIN